MREIQTKLINVSTFTLHEYFDIVANDWHGNVCWHAEIQYCLVTALWVTDAEMFSIRPHYTYTRVTV